MFLYQIISQTLIIFWCNLHFDIFQQPQPDDWSFGDFSFNFVTPGFDPPILVGSLSSVSAIFINIRDTGTKAAGGEATPSCPLAAGARGQRCPFGL